MTSLQAIILGIIQGLTEFLPISSSAHLVIVPHLLGWQIPVADAYVFDVLVQLFTLIGVFVYFWKDLLQIAGRFLSGIWKRQIFGTQEARLGWLIILATFPAGLVGLTVKPLVEQAFSDPRLAGICLLGTAALLLIAEKVGKRERSLGSLNWVDALWIGIFQALAIFPGISRSGATITAGMGRSLDRPSAARFSFLMSIPIMLAAGLLAAIDLIQMPGGLAHLPNFLPGFIAAGIFGYLSIRWLIGYLTHHPLYVFSIYCIILGTITLLVK